MKNSNRLFTLTFTSIVFINSLAFLGFNMGTFGFPFYMTVSGKNNISIGLVTTITAIAALLFRPVAGIAIDKINTSFMLFIGLILMSLPCYTILCNENNIIILTMRAIQGVGWSITSTSCSKIIAVSVPQKRLSEGIGYAGAISSLTTSCAPLIALFFSNNISTEFMVITIGLTTLVALPFLFGIHKNPKITESKTKHDKFKITNEIILSSVLIMLISFCYSPIITFLTKFTTYQGIDNTFGFFLIYAISTIIARLITGYYDDKKNAFIPIIVSMASMIICLIILYYCNNNILLCISSFFAGTSTGTGMNSLQTLCLKNIYTPQRGKAISVFLFGFDSGMALGSFVFGMIVDWIGFNLLYLLFSIIVVFGLLLSILYKKALSI